MKELHCKKYDNWTQHPEGAKCEWCGSLDTVTTTTHGGHRKGAGRKPTGKARRIIRSVNLDGEVWQRIDAKAKHKGISASELINRWGSKLKTETENEI
tara:strand:- start:10023 stop:10316 length:294 start_codon:yes stop_codon:yes gene_type:complete